MVDKAKAEEIVEIAKGPFERAVPLVVFGPTESHFFTFHRRINRPVAPTFMIFLHCLFVGANQQADEAIFLQSADRNFRC